MNLENPLDVCRSSIWAMDYDSCMDPVRKLNRTSYTAQESGKMFCDCNCCIRTDRCIWKERFGFATGFIADMRKSQYESDAASLWDEIDVDCIPETILNGIEGEIVGFKTDWSAVSGVPESLFSKTPNMETIAFLNHSAVFTLPENFLSNLQN